MKLKFKPALALLACIVLFYMACKKTSQPPDAPTPPVIAPVPPPTTTLSEAAASSLIAGNLMQTLSGAYGGVNINDGIMIPGFATQSNGKASIGADLKDLCPFFPDTLINYNTTTGDTIKSKTTGIFKFYFTCLGGYPNYSILKGCGSYDSLATVGVAPRDSFIYNIKAYYQATILDSANTTLVTNGTVNKLISFDGNVKSFVDTRATKSPINPSSIHAYYTLKGLVIDLTKNGDITSGTVAFEAKGTNNKIPWYYTGSIQFLGNHKASFTINTLTYNVDLLTGKASAGT